MILTEPLRITETAEIYDIDATLDGGGTSGQAGALRHGIARALIELDPELRPDLKKAGFLTRDDRGRRNPRSTASRRPARRRSTPSADRPLRGHVRCASEPTASRPAVRARRVSLARHRRLRLAAARRRSVRVGLRGRCSTVRVRHRPRHPCVRAPARGGAGPRPGRRRRRRRGARRGADAGGRVGVRRPRRARGGDLGVAQPLRRQRHQVVRRRRA